MNKQTFKTLLFCEIIMLAISGAAAVFFSLYRKPQTPAAKELLESAKSREAQNICLFALLEKEPDNKTYWERLLTNLAAEGADDLTLQSAAEEAKRAGVEWSAKAAGTVVIPPVSNRSPAEGLVAGGRLLHHFPNANSISGNDLLFFETEKDGLYVHYYDCVQFLSPVRAKRLIAVENGLFYLNDTEKIVQYVAADGSVTRSLSSIPAVDYAFFNGALYIAGADGRLYADDTPLDMPSGVKQLAVCGDRLFALLNGSLWCSDPAIALPGNVKRIAGSTSGDLYYVSGEDYPCVFHPDTGEARIIKEKTCSAVEEQNGKIYFFDSEVHVIK